MEFFFKKKEEFLPCTDDFLLLWKKSLWRSSMDVEPFDSHMDLWKVFYLWKPFKGILYAGDLLEVFIRKKTLWDIRSLIGRGSYEVFLRQKTFSKSLIHVRTFEYLFCGQRTFQRSSLSRSHFESLMWTVDPLKVLNKYEIFLHDSYRRPLNSLL